MSDESPAQRLVSGKSWEEFCDTLRAAGQTILAEGSPTDPLDRAEGFRYLSRLTRAALETFVEYANPLAPVLHRPVHETADRFRGLLLPPVLWLYGDAVQRGFESVTLALKKRAET